MSAAPTGKNSAKFDIGGENPNLVKTRHKKSGTLRDDLRIFLLLPATAYLHKSASVVSKGIRLLGQSRR